VNKNGENSLRDWHKKAQEKRRELLKLRQSEARKRHDAIRKTINERAKKLKSELVEVDGHLARTYESEGEQLFQNLRNDVGSELIRLDHYLDMLELNIAKQDEILKRFEIRSGVDDRIIEIGGLFYLDPDRYDYSDLIWV